jgi:glutathione S-transferase
VFYAEVTQPLLHEKMKKRLVLKQPPDAGALRTAMKLAHEHLDYIDWLTDTRRWLAGAPAQPRRLRRRGADLGRRLSRRDRLGRSRAGARLVPGDEEPPELRPLLTEKMEGIPPPANYADVNA